MKIVLIGASNNPEKFGNKILKDLISKGHTVIPINLKEKQIEGIKCFKNLGLIDEEYQIVNFVVKSEITLNILKEYLEYLKDKKIWCQPGSSNEEVKLFLENNNFKDYITDSCIMINSIN